MLEAALQEKVQALLGPDAFAQYQDYTRNLAGHLTADQFKSQLKGDKAAKEDKSKQLLETMGVEVIEKPFVAHENIATAGGCLAQQYLVGWVIEKLADSEWRELVLRSIQPVGEGLFFDDVERLQPLYAPVSAQAKV